MKIKEWLLKKLELVQPEITQKDLERGLEGIANKHLMDLLCQAVMMGKIKNLQKVVEEGVERRSGKRNNVFIDEIWIKGEMFGWVETWMEGENFKAKKYFPPVKLEFENMKDQKKVDSK